MFSVTAEKCSQSHLLAHLEANYRRSMHQECRKREDGLGFIDRIVFDCRLHSVVVCCYFLRILEDIIFTARLPLEPRQTALRCHITSAKEAMFYPAFVCLFVCPSVCLPVSSLA